MNSEACPYCGHSVDTHTGVGSASVPREGDLSICIYCGEVLVFGSGLGIRKLEPKDIVELSSEDLKKIKIARDVVNKFNACKEDKKWLG